MKEYKSTISTYEIKKIKTDFKKVKITDSEMASKMIRKFYKDDIEVFESFFILFLNRSNNTTGFVKISQGGTAGTVVDIKIVAKYAIDSLSHAIILAHNHPTGNVKPSAEDIRLTNAISIGLKVFDIIVLDHIILSGDNHDYYSFGDENLI